VISASLKAPILGPALMVNPWDIQPSQSFLHV
jgi:hypothetical protein